MHSTSLRVLTIAHNAVAASNRARVEALQRLPGFEVRLLTPPWWYEEGRRIEATGAATWHVGRTLFTGNGTRYVYTSASVRSISTWRPDVIDLFEEPFSLVALQTMLLREVSKARRRSINWLCGRTVRFRSTPRLRPTPPPFNSRP